LTCGAGRRDARATQEGDQATIDVFTPAGNACFPGGMQRGFLWEPG
jgi:hypothetical protein